MSQRVYLKFHERDSLKGPSLTVMARKKGRLHSSFQEMLWHNRMKKKFFFPPPSNFLKKLFILAKVIPGGHIKEEVL